MDDRQYLQYREESMRIILEIVKRMVDELADPEDGEAYPLFPEKEIEA